MSDGDGARRRLHAHGLHEARLRLPLVLGLSNRVDQRVYGEPLVRMTDGWSIDRGGDKLLGLAYEMLAVKIA